MALLSGSGLVVDQVDVEAHSECFEDGQVMWRLCAPDNCAIIPKGNTELIIAFINVSFLCCLYPQAMFSVNT